MERSPEEISADWEKPENQSRLETMIQQYGEYKKVVDHTSGVAYKVPTRDIITKGVRQQELDKYPIWEEDYAQ